MGRYAAKREPWVGGVPGPAPAQQPYVPKAPLRRVSRLAAIAMLGLSGALCFPNRLAAQSSDEVRIAVAATIVAKAASELALPIEIGPAHAVPPRSFVSLRGVPADVSLTEGHLVAPGLWAVPLSALPTLRAWIPADTSGRAEIGVRLIGSDGRLLAQATTALVVEPDPAQPAAPAGPTQSSPTVAARQPSRSKVAQQRSKQAAPAAPQRPPAEKARGERLLVRGLDYLVVGNVAVARDFFERAAEIGLAAAAFWLAATYDPVELPRLKIHGVVADRALARTWYERARDLGAPEAASRLARLGGGN
jgi:hypothetical protein